MFPTPADAAMRLSGQEIDRGDVIAADGRNAAAWALRFIVIIAALALLFYLLRYVWFGLLPVLLGLIVCTVLWPPVRALRKVGLPAALAVIIVILAAFGILAAVIAAMAPIVQRQGGELVAQAQQGINQIARFVEKNVDFVEGGQIQEGLNQLRSFISNQASTIASGVFSGLGAVASIGTTLVLTLILTFFFLKDGDRFLPFLRKYAGVRTGWHLTEVLMRSWNTLSGFIRTQAIVSAVDAFFIGVGLIFLGVPLWPVLAVLTFFAGFIPIIGAFTAGALSVIVALVSNGFTNAILVLILVVAVQQIEGNVLQPVLQSRAMGLHAAVVLLAVALGGTLFGIVGAFLAVPVAAVAAVFLGYWSEMVSLRAGHITPDDIKIVTQQSQTMDSKEAFLAIRKRMRSIGRSRGLAPSSANSDGVGSTRVPDSKENPSKQYDREIPGNHQAVEERPEAEKDDERMRGD
ncbi:AI-2E family transporter [Corynebacterium timonense]